MAPESLFFTLLITFVHFFSLVFHIFCKLLDFDSLFFFTFFHLFFALFSLFFTFFFAFFHFFYFFHFFHFFPRSGAESGKFAVFNQKRLKTTKTHE